jgi:hypothetical protein
MNIDDITWRLAQLASLPFQERYVICSTADEYVLDTELLENIDGLKHTVRSFENEEVLTNAQKDALEHLFVFIETYSSEVLSAKSRDEVAVLIRESSIWKTLRGKAAAALVSFGLSAEMTLEEIDQLSV